MGINNTQTSYAFGQLGSVFTDSTSTAITPPSGKVFVAITFLGDSTLDASGGLIADNQISQGREFFNTEGAAHDAALSPDRGESGTGGVQVDAGNTFPKGITIYGRYTEVDIATGGPIIAYIGE